MNDLQDESRTLRLTIYALLIITALANLTGRILNVRARDGHTPFLSANDRSRWSTISALVDYGTYEIDEVRKRPGWKSIDMVRHRGRDGQLHYYSSKPPLLPTLLAVPYWVLNRTLGVSFAEHPFYVGRLMLILINVLPLGLYLVLLMRLIEQWGETNWGRVFVAGCATWGTFLTTFGVTLNNHLPATICVTIVLYCVTRIWQHEEPHPAWFVVAGLAAAFAVANELPALAFFAATLLGLLWLFPRPTLTLFVPAALLVAVAFFVTNDWAHDSLRPPYAHRQAGDNWYDYPGSYWSAENRQGVDRGEPSRLIYAFHVLIGHHGIFSLTPIWLLSLVGLIVWMVDGHPLRRTLAAGTLGLMIVCLVFYIGLRPLQDRNYGGVTSGFRWMFWFIPAWLLALLPVADWMSESLRRQVLGGTLLAVSIVSASYAAMNPWSHPWLYTYWQSLGWYVGP